MRFSVVTPSYRQLDWLTLNAASIADQGEELEYIIQDAGSEGIAEWAAQHPQARVHVEKDAGMYDALNRGLRRATGDIVSYLNCDEQYLAGTLLRVRAFFESHPRTDVLFGDAILTDAQLQPIGYRRVVVPRRLSTEVRPLNVLTCSTFFRRRVIDEGVLFDPEWKIIGDRAWILRLLEKQYLMAVLPEPLAVFALTGKNLSAMAAARLERGRWVARVPIHVRLISPLLRAQLILAKWSAGAYRTHQADAAWYTRNSLVKRQQFDRLTLPWRWPSPKLAAA